MEKQEQQSLECHQSLITTISTEDMLKSALHETKFTEEESKNAIKTQSGKIENTWRKLTKEQIDVQCAMQAIDKEEQEKRALANHKQQMEFKREI